MRLLSITHLHSHIKSKWLLLQSMRLYCKRSSVARFAEWTIDFRLVSDFLNCTVGLPWYIAQSHKTCGRKNALRAACWVVLFHILFSLSFQNMRLYFAYLFEFVLRYSIYLWTWTCLGASDLVKTLSKQSKLLKVCDSKCGAVLRVFIWLGPKGNCITFIPTVDLHMIR